MSRDSQMQMHLGVLTLKRAEVHFRGEVSMSLCHDFHPRVYYIFFFWFSESVVSCYFARFV